MNAFKWIVCGLVLNFSIAGCAIRDQIISPYDEVLIYDIAYDLTYLRTLEAVQDVPGWELGITDKQKGFIRVENQEYGRFDDADKRVVNIILVREGNRQTSIRLAPDSRSVPGVEELMQQINRFIAPSLAR